MICMFYYVPSSIIQHNTCVAMNEGVVMGTGVDGVGNVPDAWVEQDDARKKNNLPLLR